MLILEIAAGAALAPVVALIALAIVGLLARFWKPLAFIAAGAAIWVGSFLIVSPDLN
jgi:hypothetical protein